MALNYYDVTNVILTSQPIELDPDSILYQEENIWKKYKRLSRKTTVVNVGPGILYVRSSHDGTYTSEETVIYEGQSKDYDEIYVLKLRSPSANLRYRVTEYTVSTVSGQQFSGSRFKDRRDRDGVIVYQDDYESPTIKFDGMFGPPFVDISLAPPPALIVRSTDTCFAGDFSLKTIGGNNPFEAVAMFYRHPDFHIGKIANQIHFATEELIFGVNLELDYYDGKKIHQAFVAFSAEFDIITGTLCPVRLFIAIPIVPTPSIPPFFDEIPIVTDITLFRSIHSWNTLKLTVDIANDKYVAAFVNGERIDLSGFDLLKGPSSSSKHVDSIIENVTLPAGVDSCTDPHAHTSPFGFPAIVYFDNYLLTEDETFV